MAKCEISELDEAIINNFASSGNFSWHGIEFFFHIKIFFSEYARLV